MSENGTPGKWVRTGAERSANRGFHARLGKDACVDEAIQDCADTVNPATASRRGA
jgi:hypothetical protein